MKLSTAEETIKANAKHIADLCIDLAKLQEIETTVVTEDNHSNFKDYFIDLEYPNQYVAVIDYLIPYYLSTRRNGFRLIVNADERLRYKVYVLKRMKVDAALLPNTEMFECVKVFDLEPYVKATKKSIEDLVK